MVMSSPMGKVTLLLDGGGLGWGCGQRAFPSIPTFPRQRGKGRVPDLVNPQGRRIQVGLGQPRVTGTVSYETTGCTKSRVAWRECRTLESRWTDRPSPVGGS